MESIEKLREYGHDCCARVDDAIHDYCDEIEREISEKYMLLPLDVDGVPIKCGDMVDGGMGDSGKVQHIEVWPDGFVIVYEFSPGRFTRYAPDAVRHVKPRTVEDVLEEFVNDPLWEVEGSYEGIKKQVIEKYAAELQMKGDKDGN